MTSAPTAPPPRGPALDPRAVAISDANMLRALAWRALRDGAPKAVLRAANARAAARIILRRARGDADRPRMSSGPLDLAA